MSAGTIVSVHPEYAIPGGELIIGTEGFDPAPNGGHACFIGGSAAHIVSASSTRVIVVVPPDIFGTLVPVQLESRGRATNDHAIVVGEEIVDDMHIVANPAVDPRDNSIVMTRSGTRGQQLEHTLYRLEADGYLDEMPAEIVNPTAIAFDPNGELYVTNRSAGEVCRIERGEEVITFAAGLGVATGLAFGPDGSMYVGDRQGTIYRIREFGNAERFAELDPSVAAYHLAFGPDERLYVSAPGLSSYDTIYAIDGGGRVVPFARGFGRPQGLAFDVEGSLYAAACFQGRHGIVRIESGSGRIETVVAGNEFVGLCFNLDGDLIAATGESLFALPMNIKGLLLS